MASIMISTSSRHGEFYEVQREAVNKAYEVLKLAYASKPLIIQYTDYNEMEFFPSAHYALMPCDIPPDCESGWLHKPNASAKK